MVDLVDTSGAIRRVAVAHADPEKQALAEELRGCPLDPGAGTGVPRVLRTGEAELDRDVSHARVAAFAGDARHLEILRRLGPRSSINVPLSARGRILGAITFVSTESHRRYGAPDLALAAELARRAALAVDNARLYLEAQEAIQVRDAFLTSTSHDLRTPLATVKGYAQLLAGQLSVATPPVPEAFASGLARIDAATTRMVKLIDEVLDVAHLQAGRPLELERRRTDLVALAQQVAAEQQQMTTRHRIVVEVGVSELVGQWDPNRLERVVANLLSNAIKYSRQGGDVCLRVARVVDDGGAWALLTVQDQGLGIPAADLPQVFERFYRGQNVRGQLRGSGIGLAGARDIVAQHGGTISVASQEGQGSTFTVRLPVDFPSSRRTEPGQAADPREPARKRHST